MDNEKGLPALVQYDQRGVSASIELVQLQLESSSSSPSRSWTLGRNVAKEAVQEMLGPFHMPKPVRKGVKPAARLPTRWPPPRAWPLKLANL